MLENQKDIVLGRNRSGPLILLFSQRERVRDILSVGLAQCDYRVVPAETAFLATIKANQFLPELVIVDITINNTKDVLLVARLRKSIRTRNVSILVVIPKDLRHVLDQGMTEHVADRGFVHVIEYPFNFSELLSKVKGILFQSQADKEKEAIATGSFPATNEAVARLLLDRDQPVARKLAGVESVLKQWAFPFVVIRALDIIESSASCCDELASCISADPGASAAILKVANTVYYAKRGKRVTDVKEAVVRLGFRETRNLLACLALIDLSPELYKNYGFDRHEFWLHSLASALIAEKICVDLGYRRPELAFLAGLVHDLGKIPIDNNISPLFAHLLEKTANGTSTFYETEEELLGFSHSALGHYLTTKWNFPEVISLAILNHHLPDRILAMPTPNDRIVHEAVYVANLCAKAMNIGHSCDEIIREIPAIMLNDLHIQRGPSETFFAAVYRSLYFMCKHLDLSTKNLFISRPHPDHEKQEVLVVLGARITFHPVVLALKEAGFTVKSSNQYVPDLYPSVRVIVSIPEKGFPLNIMVFEDEAKEPGRSALLKIFLLDVLPEKKMLKGVGDADIVFLDKNHLDFRAMLSIIDQFLEMIVVPKVESIDLGEDEDSKA